MKYKILLYAFVLLFATVSAQQQSSPGITWLGGTLKIKEDTFKVVLLVSDTALYPIHSYSKSNKDCDTCQYLVTDTMYMRRQFPYIIVGYEVTNMGESPFYLDESKNRLPKNLIIWQERRDFRYGRITILNSQ